MNDFVLGVVCLALIVFSAYSNHQASEDRKKFIKALLAKDLRDFDTSEKIEHEEVKEEEEPDSVPLDGMSDDDFHKQIQIQLKRSEDGQE